jgi:hypothetical protein
MNKIWKLAWLLFLNLLSFFSRKKILVPGVIAVDRNTGTIFGCGEEIPKSSDVAILKRGTPAGTVVLEGEICEDSGSIWRRRYRITRSYYLADRFFTEAEISPEDRELWRVDLRRLHAAAATELSAVAHGAYDYAKKDQEYFDLYEWCGEPLREEKIVTVMDRYSEDHL